MINDMEFGPYNVASELTLGHHSETGFIIEEGGMVYAVLNGEKTGLGYDGFYDFPDYKKDTSDLPDYIRFTPDIYPSVFGFNKDTGAVVYFARRGDKAFFIRDGVEIMEFPHSIDLAETEPALNPWKY